MSQSSPPFSTGPRLVEPPQGDETRQAIASLGGYAYQLYVSALAWVELADDQELYVEVAEDYAIASSNALNAVQVKNVSKTTSVTINSKDICNTLNAFVDLVEKNPTRKVSLRFLSTAAIGKEKRKEDRINEEPVLSYWRRAAAGADILPLRRILTRSKINSATKAFINHLNDDAFRQDFLGRIHWDCGQHGLESVRDELDANLIRYGVNRLKLPTTQCSRLSAFIAQEMLRAATSAGLRCLTGDALLQLLENATRISLPQYIVEELLRSSLGNDTGAEEESTTQIDRGVLEPESELPFPSLLAPRTDHVTKTLSCLKSQGCTFITGATGTGKTLLARLTAHAHGGTWFICDLLHANSVASATRLKNAINELASLKLTGVIIDDLNVLEDPTVQRALARFLGTAKRRDILLLVTTYREPSARVLNELGLDQIAHSSVPDLSTKEVADLVTAAGGDASTWADVVYQAGSFGHPQLIQAVIAGLQLRDWPKSELPHRLSTLSPSSSDIETERHAARLRLLAEVPEGAKNLLCRMSLLIGRCDRSLALVLGQLPPPINQPGQQLDTLIGPWIDQAGRGELRVSPLVAGIGAENLGIEERTAVHCAIAETILSGTKIDITKADSAFLHALFGKSETTLMKLAYGVLTANTDIRRKLPDWLMGLRFHRLDRLIYKDNPFISCQLRLSQFLLNTEKGNAERIQEIWATLNAEIHKLTNNEARDHFEYLALSKALIDPSCAGLLPNWIDLIFRYEELTNTNPEFKKLAASMEQKRPPNAPTTIAGLLFVVQALGIRSVTDLASVFNRLDAFTKEWRDQIFDSIKNLPSDYSLIVSSGWLYEHKLGTLNGESASKQYQHMANQAQAWGHRDLAIRCHVARSIMLDEYANDASAALLALDEATKSLGPSAVLARARAKIHYRQKDHAGTLPLLRQLAEAPELSDPVERTYMFREAGISAAELGDWIEARKWLTMARDAAGTSIGRQMRAMAIGLQADAAIAAFNCGDVTGMLVGLADSIDSLATLDPNSSTKAAYCHRVVRHTVLWAYGKLTGRSLSVSGSAPTMLIGMCSNPEPPEDIKNLPLGPIDPVWYLLAEADVTTGMSANIVEKMRSRLKGHAIPTMEIILRHATLARAVVTHDVDSFIAKIIPWVDSQVYLERNPNLLRNSDPMNPSYGEIDQPSSEQLQTPKAIFAAEDGFLTFGIIASISNHPDSLVLLSDRCQKIIAANTSYAGFNLAPIMHGAKGSIERLDEKVAALIHSIASSQDDIDPKTLFIANLRFLQITDRSNFKDVLAPALRDWTRRMWQRVIDRQRFHLLMPVQTVPMIQSAIDSDGNDMAVIARILLTSNDAVEVPIAQSFRDFLQSLVTPN